jgi:ABC-type dipeptide/oligopeptide/nickel transport system ATPase subunit
MPHGDDADVVCEVRDLHYTYPSEYGQPPCPVLGGLSFSLRRGRALGVLGMNECGKTTLARVLTAARPPTSGSVTVFGTRLHQLGSRPRWARDGLLLWAVYSAVVLLGALLAFGLPRALLALLVQRGVGAVAGQLVAAQAAAAARQVAVACALALGTPERWAQAAALPLLLGAALLHEHRGRGARRAAALAAHARRVAYLTSEDSPGSRVSPKLTVEAYIGGAARAAAIAARRAGEGDDAKAKLAAEVRAEVVSLLRTGGLIMYDHATQKPWGDAEEYVRRGLAMGQLSGGQKQLVHCLAVLAARPALLVCDEPLCGLDLATRARVIGLIRRRQVETGGSLLYLSCEMDAVQLLSDEVGFMTLLRGGGSDGRDSGSGSGGGQIVAVAPRAEALARPGHAEFARFVEASREMARGGNPAAAVEREMPAELAKHLSR